jgi:hypothetical protein
MELNNDWVGSLTVFENIQVIPTISDQVGINSITSVFLRYVQMNDIVTGCIRLNVTASGNAPFSFKATTPTSTGLRLGFGGGARTTNPDNRAVVIVNDDIFVDAGNTTNLANRVWYFDFTYAIF